MMKHSYIGNPDLISSETSMSRLWR